MRDPVDRFRMACHSWVEAEWERVSVKQSLLSKLLSQPKLDTVIMNHSIGDVRNYWRRRYRASDGHSAAECHLFQTKYNQDEIWQAHFKIFFMVDGKYRHHQTMKPRMIIARSQLIAMGKTEQIYEVWLKSIERRLQAEFI